MDMKISGSGAVPAGEYGNIKISGSGRLYGRVRCENFYASGSSKGETIECGGEFKISGSGCFLEDVKAGAVSVSGSFSCGGDITADGRIACSGSLNCKRNIKCDIFSLSGSASVAGDIEAETVKASGVLNCTGLLNAEEVSIKFERGMEIGSIGGSRITVLRDRRVGSFFNLFSLGRCAGVVRVGAIEGDVIEIENVSAPVVTGRNVKIGSDCEIDLVQYSDEVEISHKAKVGRTEKV